MRAASRLMLVALLVCPTGAGAQEETRRPVPQGQLIRVTYSADTGQAMIRGTYSGEHAGQLVLASDQGDRRSVGVNLDLIQRVEVGKRGHAGGVVGAILGGVLGAVAGKAAFSSDSEGSCGELVCVDVDEGAILGGTIMMALGAGLGYFLGHQFDGVQWSRVAYPTAGTASRE